MLRKPIVVGLLILLGLSLSALVLLQTYRGGRNARVLAWLRNPAAYPEWKVTAKHRCEDAVFFMPTEGFIGYLWGDSFRPFHRHQGIDIFGGTKSGLTPVFAAYDGFLTRKADWKSSLIIRVPQDPLQPDRQIWLYMTHLADPAGESLIDARFPAGSVEIPVKAGELLGYQGSYSGDPAHPVGVHLHFSIVLDDGGGSYLNELKIKNTLDPSPYFNLALNGKTSRDAVPTCADLQ